LICFLVILVNLIKVVWFTTLNRWYKKINAPKKF
jgi:hypothetical protein